jgi:hypothetical protein
MQTLAIVCIAILAAMWVVMMTQVFQMYRRYGPHAQVQPHD